MDLQVSFAFTSPIPWDKAPNKFGHKTFAVDPTMVCVNQDEADVALAGNLVIQIAIAQGIIEYEDLAGLKLGEGYSIAQIIENRKRPAKPQDVTPDQVKDMYALQPTVMYSGGTLGYLGARSPHLRDAYGG